MGNVETWGAGVGFCTPSVPGAGHAALSLILSPAASSSLTTLPLLPAPTSGALVGVTGRLDRALGISSLGDITQECLQKGNCPENDFGRCGMGWKRWF